MAHLELLMQHEWLVPLSQEIGNMRSYLARTCTIPPQAEHADNSKVSTAQQAMFGPICPAQTRYCRQSTHATVGGSSQQLMCPPIFSYDYTETVFHYTMNYRSVYQWLFSLQNTENTPKYRFVIFMYFSGYHSLWITETAFQKWTISQSICGDLSTWTAKSFDVGG